MKRECHRLVSRPLYLFCMVIAPLFCYIFFTTLMDSGLPTNMPVGAVGLDNSASSRNILRNLDAFGQTAVVARYSSVNEARTAMQEGKIYGFLYTQRNVGRCPESTPTQIIFLYQQLLPDCRLIIVQGYEDDVRTCLRSCRPFSFICQGSNGRSGDGIFTTHCH